MPSTSDRQALDAGAVAVPRRHVLAGLVGLPILVALSACTSRSPQPHPSGTSSTFDGVPSTTPVTEPPAVDAAALETTADDAITLLAAYEATIAAHPALAPVLAPYAIDHDTHLEALAERITLPTSSPVGSSPVTSTPPDSPPIGPSSTVPPVPPVPTDPAAARAALVQAEEVTGAAARDAARSARDGEAARLLASIGASRAVHALLLGAPA